MRTISCERQLGRRRGPRALKAALLALLALAALLVLAGCAHSSLLPEDIPSDNCRNWYEIFVWSFCDSDGDRIGDLKGAASKLPYIRSLGFTGVWLMPVHPSPTYHKYDVEDYLAIDPAYGTVEDLEAFVAEAHRLGIKVIMDLVVNHTSNLHPWFQDAKAGPDAPKRSWYNFVPAPRSGYNKIGSSYYESRFTPSMPDLNLDSPAVREEIRKIAAFWLGKGVDGFRLDAVTSYFTGRPGRNIEFLDWLEAVCQEIKPGCFLVGEAWADASTIANYASSRLDSFFYFPYAGKGGYASLVDPDAEVEAGREYGRMTEEVESRLDGKLRAMFVGNHDMDRIASVVGTWDLRRLKAVHGMLAMSTGGLFAYYGDEIGMLGKGPDPNKRIGMLWTSRAEATKCPPGTKEAVYSLPGVLDQQSDPNSLLNYDKAALNLRNAFPAIARGRSAVVPQEDGDLCVMERSFEGRRLVLVLNLSPRPKSLSLEAHSLLGALDADLSSGSGIVYKDGALSLDPWGIAVLEAL